LLIAGPPAALTADTLAGHLMVRTTAASAIATPGPRAQPASIAVTGAPVSVAAIGPSPAAGQGIQAGGPEARSRQLIVPDLLAVVPAGVNAAQLSEIRGLRGVRAVLAVNGGQVLIGGRTATLLGVPTSQFRSWTPPATAAATGIWAALDDGNLVASSTAQASLGLRLGRIYQITAAGAIAIPVTATGPLGIPGAAAIVDTQRSAQLGLARDVAVLVNAPGVDYTTLSGRIRAITGPHGKIITLVPATQPGTLPVARAAARAKPSNWLQLYQDSAADYCPGLSWTVLAAIGEIESGDGENDGPSTAGARGPMQFMPATWAAWDTDGFGQTGPPDVMNPYDAVPSAARLLCADGAGGTLGLSAAIFDYNHAGWYVSEVLALASEYAQEYPRPGAVR
jgi:hypothetical protein